jgi:hypothetical protein
MGRVHFFSIFLIARKTDFKAALSSGKTVLALVYFRIPLLRLSMALVV